MSNPFEDDHDTNVKVGPWNDNRPAPDNKVVVTLKGGSGFDAPWIVVHAESVGEAKRILGDEIKELMTLASAAGKYFAGLGGSKSAAPRAEAPAQHQTKPGDPDMPEGWTYKTGSKNGKTWRAYFPPKGSDESPMWLK